MPPFTQVHDLNGGIYPNGLFWTVVLPPGAFSLSRDGRNARLRVGGVCVIDTFTLIGTPSPLGTIGTPAELRLDVEWQATGHAVPRGSGLAGPAAEQFLGEFAPAQATGTFSATELGFGFSTNGRASSHTGYAEIGTERNGSFL